MDSPIRGRTRELASKFEATVPMNIHNRFDIEVIDARTGKIKQRAQAENVICSQLWTRLLSTDYSYFNYIHYGTGSGTPSSTDTHLFTFLGYGSPAMADDVFSSDYANCVYSLRRKIQLSETTAAGSTLTEVGIGYSDTSSSLCTHAMLKDANGNQISISKTATDIINIYASVFVHFSNSIFSTAGPIIVNMGESLLQYLTGCYTNESYTFRDYCKPPKYAVLSKGRFAPYCSISASSIYPTRSSLSAAFNTVTKTITLTMMRLGANDSNVSGGALYVVLFNYFNNGLPSHPVIALKSGNGWYGGTNITAEPIGTGDGSTVDFATAFDWPSNATAYVNGVANTEVSVDNAPTATTNMQLYFEPVKIENGAILPVVGIAQNSNNALGSGIWYNPNYSYGIKTIYNPYSGNTLSVSDDGITWSVVPITTSGTITIPAAYRCCKYWQISIVSDNPLSAFTTDTLTNKNVHFTTPPASGAVIAADYHTPVIAKDANHVFDLTVTIQLGEYTS